eukprot:scaffold64145_cov61-Cyclotella_meneghiniana.AAC.1
MFGPLQLQQYIFETREIRQPQLQVLSKEGNYKALALHEEGHWEHLYALPHGNSNVSFPTEVMNKTYLPIEIDWMRGENLPKIWSICPINTPNCPAGIIYQSKMGNKTRDANSLVSGHPSLNG